MKLSFPQGLLADERLAAHQLILTQGGEPTFVPLDPSKPEWNSDALGAEKLFFARRLARHLVPAFLPGAVVLESFGKQYPGEPLPRWRIGLYRGKGPEALWSDLSLIRLDQPPSVAPAPDLARTFLTQICSSLHLENTALPAYENVAERIRLASEGQDIHPLPRFSRSKRRFEIAKGSRARLAEWAHLFSPAGYVLPLDFQGGRWVTSSWQTPLDEGLTLIVGDSPIGLRLPLSSLREPSVRTALTAEVKEGELIVFLPPLPDFSCFSLLVRVIERTLADLASGPASLQGYPPLEDREMAAISLMADPGVIEVNLPPAADWPSMETLARLLFSAAEQSGLVGYKFHYSGRKSGTGGGAHVILGGPSLEQNPFVARPSLLSGFLRFIQNHPSLSYLFTGAFVGPSSQAPRVDESAFEVPYELEITLKALEKIAGPGDPQQIDAMLRSLLLDWNGNTHRAEISIDKFHNASAPNGRQGLVEFRAFEMAPEPEMFLAVNALIRSLAAAFADEAFTAPLIDWREALHDRFALPHFLWEDLGAVLDYLRARGFSFDPETFRPQLDFRFPLIYECQAGGDSVRLREALEPWPVMGESGASRVVDASTDRLELSVSGSPLVRVGASVNGFRVPLVRQSDGLAVGAIRYRLFDNPYGLQPHVRAHSPLAFDLFDLKTGTIAHAFDYLNWRPEGGGYPGLPENETEARRRVGERLVLKPGRCGAQAVFRELPLSEKTPFTLDLRAVS